MSAVAFRTRSISCSNENSGVWTPITMSPSSRYACDHARTYGSVRSQLMHVSVQKSTRTTWPRRSSGSSGCELSHPVPPSSLGMWVRSKSAITEPS
jgi:hypothetical protein